MIRIIKNTLSFFKWMLLALHPQRIVYSGFRRKSAVLILTVFSAAVFNFIPFHELGSWPFKKKKSEENAQSSEIVTEEPRKGKVSNSIRYIVGDIAITELDIDDMKLLLEKKRRSGGDASRKPVDELIVRAIVEIESRASSIIVSDTKVNNEIKKRMEASGITNEAVFQNLVSKETGVPFELWVEDLRYQIKRHQLIQIAIPIPQPTDAELRQHYNKKINQIGFEVLYREIVFRPLNSSSSEELRVSDLARAARTEIMKNPANFSRIARTHPDNVSFSKNSGGLVGYLFIHEIAQTDRILATQLAGMAAGQVSPVFRDQGNRYVVIRMEGKRPIPFEKAKPLLQQDIYMNNVDGAFDQWIEKRKKETAIVEVK